MSASAAVSSGGAIVEVANFLKEYMAAMEQLPRTAQLLASQIMDLDKNSHCTLSELEHLTQSANFVNASLPSDLRRRLKRSLIELQTIGDEQHRLLGDVGDGIQRYTHRVAAQRKEAEQQLRSLQAKGGAKSQELFEASTSVRDAAPAKRKRVRESVPGGTPAKHSKRQPKDASPGPSVASSCASGARRGSTSLAPRKGGSAVSAKKASASTASGAPPAPVGGPPAAPAVKKKKKKRKSVSTPAPNEKPVASGPVGGSEKAPSGGGSGGGNSGAAKGARRRQEGGDVASNSSAGGHEEPRYCLCGGVSSGRMVGCDGPGCQVEWFHFECVGLTEAPKGNWYCANCEQNAAARPSRRAKAKGASAASGGGTGGR